MDAKVGDWVVTPRRGKAVEINALWYNALRLLADWLREAHDPEADEFAAHPDKSHDSFNRRFWHAAGGYLCDVVDGENGDDTAFRPNQIFAIALDHPVLDREYWEPVVTAVHAKLVTRSGCALWRRASPSTNRAISAMCVRAMLPITRARYGPG
jgi:predicted glycogen debranching enzyme